MLENLFENTVSGGANLENKTGQTGDEIFAGTESAIKEIITADVSPIVNFSKTYDAIQQSIDVDRVGIESGSVNPFTVKQSLVNLDTILSMGLNANAGPIPGMENVESNPVRVLEVGIEAKEGYLAKIIRKIKEYIKSALLKIGELKTKVITMGKMAMVNAKALKDKADELEDTDMVKFDKEEDLAVHDKFIRYVGFNFDPNKNVKENMTNLKDLAVSAYKEPIKSDIDGVINNIKAGTSVLKYGGYDTYVNATKLLSDKFPATSSVRKLANDDKIVAGTVFRSPSNITLTVLKKTDGKDPRFTIESAKELHKPDGLTYDKMVTGSVIKEIAVDLVDTFNNYDVKDVVKAVYDRLKTLNKDVSEETKNMKSKYTSRVMKFVSFYNTVSTKAIRTVVENQKTYYSAVKLLVNNAE